MKTMLVKGKKQAASVLTIFKNGLLPVLAR